MGRRKIHKPRRDRPGRDFLDAYADAYRCGHCHSAVGWPPGEHRPLGTLRVMHDDSCPVLAGTVSDLPDAVRAAEKSGAMVVVDARTGQHLTTDADGLVALLDYLGRRAGG